MNPYNLKAELILKAFIKQIRLLGVYKEATAISEDELFVMGKQAAIYHVAQLMNEHSITDPSPRNVERREYWNKVYFELKLNF